eukprot:CAMPEP_0178419254 /NCGR_PEP_ID=MMETSP0689_2-20121128/25514_1 /TAXON_ID=160604 /ORGANISM="Amphidinium massartii, Strain CS-259" /LENGTH=185 /DNA_ID=CAMNT_0020040683 /DNA_START=94 /DNA_END=648 /DNA_ORIENTATION=+
MGNVNCCCEDKSAAMSAVVLDSKADRVGPAGKTAEASFFADTGGAGVQMPQEPRVVRDQRVAQEEASAASKPERDEGLVVPTPPPAAPKPEASVAQPSGNGNNEFYADLKKAEGQKLGMIIAYFSQAKCVQVRTINDDGAVAKWNSENPSKAISEGHFLVEVNGEAVAGKTEAQVGELLNAGNEM